MNERIISGFGWWLGVSLCWLVTACDIIEYHPYDTRFDGPVGINARNIARIEETLQGRDSLRFAVLSDTQRWYDETHKAVNDINARGDIDFVLHLGDMSDFGLTREMVWMRDELLRLQPPFVCLIGNHDCLGTGADVYRRMYGDPNFAFDAGDTHFVCLNTNAFEYDYSIAIPDFNFLRDDITATHARAGVRRTVIAMHAAPTTDQFNNNTEMVFHEYLRRYPQLQFCLCGHTHLTMDFEPLKDGILYHECGAAKGRKYLIITLRKEGSHVCEAVSY